MTPIISKLVVAFSFVVLSNSCGIKESLSRRVTKVEQEVLDEQIGYASIQPQGTNLTWKQAFQIFNERNTQMVRGRDRLKEIEDDRRRFYWNQLGPRLSGVASLSTALDDLASLDTDDISIQVFGNIRVPQPFTLYGTRYALELRYYLAILDFEEYRRQSTADLYEVFIAQEVLNNEIASSQASLEPIFGENLQASITKKFTDESESNERSLRQQAERIRQRLNALLNTPGRDWKLQFNSLPTVNYERRYKKLSFKDGFGRLGLRQAAAQIESNRANLWRVKLNRLPSLSLNASLPTLYNSRNDTSPSIEDIRLFSGLTKSIAFDGSRAKSLRSAEERAIATRTRISLQLEQEATKFRDLKENFEQLQKAEKRLLRRKQLLRRSTPPAIPELLLDHIKQLNQIEEDLSSNRATRVRLSLQFWIWDEDAWASTQRNVEQ